MSGRQTSLAATDDRAATSEDARPGEGLRPRAPAETAPAPLPAEAGGGMDDSGSVDRGYGALEGAAGQTSEGRLAPKSASRAASKTYRITRPALDHFLDLRRESFIEFGNLRLADHVAVGRAMDRLSVSDGLVDLKPQSPMDRYVADRARRRTSADDDEDAPDDAADEVVRRRRRAWDEAKRAGDPDEMTRAANALLRAVEEARAHLSSDEGAQAAPPEGERHRTSEILNPQSDDERSPPTVDENVDAPPEDLNTGAFPTFEREAESDADLLPGESARVPLEVTSEKLRSLTHGQAQSIADAILAAPEDRREQMVRRLWDDLGETATTQVMGRLPPPQFESLMFDAWATHPARVGLPDGQRVDRRPRSDGGVVQEHALDNGADDRVALRHRNAHESPARDDLPDKIDYGRTRPNSRPVLVVGLPGAGGGGNRSFGELTRSLGGQVHLTTNDETADDVVETIRRFQRAHPDGIVVVLAYSHGAWDFRTKIAGRTDRPVDIALFFDPYNANDDIAVPAGSVRRGFNFYQQNETDSPWYNFIFGGDNPFKGSKVTNPEFTNYDLTGESSVVNDGAKIGHNSIVEDVRRRYRRELDRVLRR